MQTKHTRLSSGGYDLEKRMPRVSRIMPLVIRDLLSTEKPDRMIRARSPERKSGGIRESFNNVRPRCFLKDDEIGLGSFDRFSERRFAAHSTKSDVVTE